MSLLDLKIEVILNDNHPVKKYCGTGTHMGIYDVDGALYPCHLFTPLVLSRARIVQVMPAGVGTVEEQSFGFSLV